MSIQLGPLTKPCHLRLELIFFPIYPNLYLQPSFSFRVSTCHGEVSSEVQPFEIFLQTLPPTSQLDRQKARQTSWVIPIHQTDHWNEQMPLKLLEDQKLEIWYWKHPFQFSLLYYPPEVFSARPLKMMVKRRSFPFGMVVFQGLR